jgi:hypothetical protein
MVPRVEPRRVAHMKPLHRRAQVRLRRLQHPVPVITHQRKGMNPDPVSLAHRSEQFDEMPAILVVREDHAAIRSSVVHVVPPVHSMNAQRSCHAESISSATPMHKHLVEC